MMLDNGIDPSMRTQFDWASLHWAIYYGHLDCVNLLIQAGAELSSVSDLNATLLDLALRANQGEIVDLLARADAKKSRHVQVFDKTQKMESNSRSERSASDVSIKILLTLTSLYIKDYLLVSSFMHRLCQTSRTGSISFPSLLRHHQPPWASEKPAGELTWSKYPLAPRLYDSSGILYDIWRNIVNYQQLELRGGTQSKYSGIVTMHRDWTGGWKARHNYGSNLDYLLRRTPDWSKMKDERCRWTTKDKKLLARTGIEDVTFALCFELDLERDVQNVPVSCWVGKLWSKTVASLKEES